MRLLSAVAFVVVALASASAWATYSIAASDPSRGVVGAAGASCVDYEVIRIHGSVDGRAVIEAQANFDDAALAEGVSLLGQGRAPDEVLAAISDASLFPIAPKMQYGIVDVAGRAVAWTGPEALAVADHLSGSVDGFAFAVQGNLLTSSKVLERMRQAFGAGGCDLAERLVLALEAAGEQGEGDSRCTPEGRPANSAFVEVSSLEGKLLRISLPDVSPNSPIDELRAELDGWRVDHPCPTAAGGATAGAGGSAASVAGGDEGGCAIAGGESRWSQLVWLMVGLALGLRRSTA